VPERLARLGQLHGDVAGLLGDPRFGGVGGDAEQVDSAGGDLDDEQDVDAAEQDGVDVEEVGGHNPGSLSGEELGPGRAGPPGAGSTPERLRMSHTVEGATRWPRPSSSPWMRR